MFEYLVKSDLLEMPFVSNVILMAIGLTSARTFKKDERNTTFDVTGVVGTIHRMCVRIARMSTAIIFVMCKKECERSNIGVTGKVIVLRIALRNCKIGGK